MVVQFCKWPSGILSFSCVHRPGLLEPGLAPPGFGRSVNPISTRGGADFAHPITYYLAHPRFSFLPMALHPRDSLLTACEAASNVQAPTTKECLEILNLNPFEFLARVSKVVADHDSLLKQSRYRGILLVISSLQKSEFLKLIILFFHWFWHQNWDQLSTNLVLSTNQSMEWKNKGYFIILYCINTKLCINILSPWLHWNVLLLSIVLFLGSIQFYQIRCS